MEDDGKGWVWLAAEMSPGGAPTADPPGGFWKFLGLEHLYTHRIQSYGIYANIGVFVDGGHGKPYMIYGIHTDPSWDKEESSELTFVFFFSEGFFTTKQS